MMTTLTLRRIKDDFIVTGPDIEPTKFKSRREAKDWCMTKYPGSPIKEIGADATKRAKKERQTLSHIDPYRGYGRAKKQLP
jgi:hypothetical protein